ncbi:MAG: DUF4954 family protein [Saprospiraceae bacterium]|nr:DUF4954 family protein [Saprospiraceae bacterium]
MSNRLHNPLNGLGYDFLTAPFLPKGADEFYLRDKQFGNDSHLRSLTAAEMKILIQNGNLSDDWSGMQVGNQFDPQLVRNCRFYGRIRMGDLQPGYLEFHELKLPVGIYNSTILSCDFGNNVAINQVNYLSHYIIGDEVILFNINEMHATNYARFGNGIIKEGEEEKSRIWMEICNENGGRKVLPFDGMLPADAWLWSKFRGDGLLMQRFKEITEREFTNSRGYYGTVGDRSIIKNTRILKDVKVGSYAYIKGGNKLKNLTINSSREAPSQIGEGVEMVNGIMGYGSRAFYGIKAVRFVMGENTTLKYGARLINSYLGDNSTISCCEVLNSLIFPGHEQHHNNSFLVAATVLGQSNIAAAASIGSNHNSREADGEIIAGRGFWPGLGVSLQHHSKFASYCLIAKGSYPAELNIPFPFALVSNNVHENHLQVMPAYWFMYNMYALSRSASKYIERDQRIFREQIVFHDYLAPDTIEEIFSAMRLLELYVVEAFAAKYPSETALNPVAVDFGRHLLVNEKEKIKGLAIFGTELENSNRKVKILKAVEAYQMYRDMVHFYCVRLLINYATSNGIPDFDELSVRCGRGGRQGWLNVGGQLMPKHKIEQLIQKIQSREIESWKAIHAYYHKIHSHSEEDQAIHAFNALPDLYDMKQSNFDKELWHQWLEKSVTISRTMVHRTKESRKKDFTNKFKRITYDTPEEMQAVLGTIDENKYIAQVTAEAQAFEKKVMEVIDTW